MMKQLAKFKSAGVILGLGAALVLFNGLGWVSIAGFSQDSIRPVSRSLTAWGRSLGVNINNFVHSGSLSEENKRLREENAKLLQQITELKEVERENEQLRKQLQFGSKSQATLLGADVIGYQPDGVRQLLVIDRGADDGLKPGMSAIYEGHLVGKVESVNAHSAQLLLLSDEQFRVLVVDQNSRTPGIVKGQVGGSTVMEQIPQSEHVSAGDVIVTSGTDGEFPAGLVIGTVSNVAQSGQSIFKAAQIRQSFSPLDLRVVMILLKP